MRIGVPGGLLFPRYEAGLRTFFGELAAAGAVEAVYSEKGSREILNLGISCCVDEACLPMKLFHGHVAKLQESCDVVAVPRLMKCACGSVVCPKFAGLPELVRSGTGKSNLAFTGPLQLNDKKRSLKMVMESGKELGIPPAQISRAFHKGWRVQELWEAGRIASEQSGLLQRAEKAAMTATEEGQKRPALKVVLMGHPYNTRDTFANRNLVRKLEALGLNAVFGDSLYATGKADKARLMGDGKLIKMPYWISLRENYGSAGVLRAQGGVDGAVYVSSFNCGPDSFIIEMVRERLGDLPLLVLKLDEQTGEAGLDTRLEAFAELLERRTRI